MSVRMKINIYSCLFAFVVSCNAVIIHKIMEKDSITLPCPHSVEGKVTWSRESNGHKVGVLIVDGDQDIRLIKKPYKRYSSLADKSLHIHRADTSDAAKYFCNNEPAAELRVIPSGTTRITAPERTSVILTCPADARGSAVPTWTKDPAVSQNGKGEQIHSQRWFYVSPVDKTLTITDVQPGDSGLYYCDGKPAAYLN